MQWILRTYINRKFQNSIRMKICFHFYHFIIDECNDERIDKTIDRDMQCEIVQE